MMKKILLSFISLSAIIFFACSDDEGGNNNTGDNDPVVEPTDDEGSTNPEETIGYDAEALLTSWVNNHIIPNYTEFATLTANLITAKNALVAENSVENLQAFRSSYLTAYTFFQRMGLYNVGLADDLNYYLFLNVYPTNTANIEGNVSSGVTVDGLSGTLTQSAQGFPAIDYLINGIADTDEEIVNALTNAHLNYLSIIVDKIDDYTSQILTDWESGYAETFIANSGSDAGGSPNVFYNALVFYFENNIRRQKIDLPAGLFTSSTFPDIIESLFNPEESRDFLLEAFEQFENFYLGSEADTESISTALIGVGREDLDTAIKDQFVDAKDAISALDPNLKLQIETNNTAMLVARDEIQKLVVFFKSDVPSALDFSILFADNDGD